MSELQSKESHPPLSLPAQTNSSTHFPRCLPKATTSSILQLLPYPFSGACEFFSFLLSSKPTANWALDISPEAVLLKHQTLVTKSIALPPNLLHLFSLNDPTKHPVALVRNSKNDSLGLPLRLLPYPISYSVSLILLLHTSQTPYRFHSLSHAIISFR